MSQKQFKRYRKAGEESAVKVAREERDQIEKEILRQMVSEKFSERMAVAWLILLGRVEVKK